MAASPFRVKARSGEEFPVFFLQVQFTYTVLRKLARIVGADPVRTASITPTAYDGTFPVDCRLRHIPGLFAGLIALPLYGMVKMEGMKLLTT